ncbi:MAG TPA: HD domain-containing phosphohydrolase, partial [Gaiellaceae bacterium]|nr:HD domain-containing phosphohydrolase [Gaiellaceae bacterium]
MRELRSARLRPALPFLLGCGLVAVATYRSFGEDLGAVAVLAAAVIAAETLHRRDDDVATDEDEADGFSAAAPVAAAAAIVVGPWPALLVTAPTVFAVRRLSGETWTRSGLRSLALGLAALAGGYAYVLAGAKTGSLVLPDDLLGVCTLAIAFAAAKSVVLRVAAGSTIVHPDPLSAAAEVGAAAILATAVESNLWYAALVVPLLALVERLSRRLLALRQEVASALEVFANIVDERDASTYGHSLRVAEGVRELAEAVGFSRAEAHRLWWAGRLHDLGKVAVDAAVLRKRGRLDDTEWAAVRRAPRLSARLLQRFRFAAQQAKAVEYHRERLDGSGYYGARGADLPLAAHFLIVVDSFDAMTSDRPFRPRMSPAEALAEIEANAGTQFHPLVARAFVAVQRGRPPADALSPDELAELTGAAAPPSVPVASTAAPPELAIALGIACALVGVGIDVQELVAVGVAVAASATALRTVGRFRAARLRRRLEKAVAAGGETPVLFERIIDAFRPDWPLEFAQLVDWHEDGAGGTIVLARGATSVPEA